MSDFNLSELDELEVPTNIQDPKYEDKVTIGIPMGFIGVGQGGCRIADTFYKIGYRKVLLFNTTEKDMSGLETPKENQIVASGFDGAGKDIKVGEEASKSIIPELLEKMNTMFLGVSNIVVCVGAGGGTGTGSAITIANQCEQWIYNTTGKYEKKVGFIIALPERNESQKIFLNSVSLLGSLGIGNNSKNITEDFNPIVFIDNQRIMDCVKANAINKWNKANNLVCELFHIFNMMCAKDTDFDTFDPTDYSDVLSNGITSMSLSSISEEYLLSKVSDEIVDSSVIVNKVKESLSANLLIKDMDITNATKAAIIVSCRKEALEMLDSSLMSKLQEMLNSIMCTFDKNKSITIHKGLYARETGDTDSKMRIFMMFSGMPFSEKKMKEYYHNSGLDIPKQR